MSTIKFILRRSQRGPSYCGSVCARIIHARKVKVLTLPISLYPHEWDEKGESVITGDEESERSSILRQGAETLAQYREQFAKLTARLEKQGRYSLSDIAFGCHTRRSQNSLSGFSEHLSTGLRRSGQERTARAYLTAVRALTTFNKGQDIPLKHINACMIKEFETYLKERGKAMNTISYYMRMLRAIYHRAVKDHLIEPKQDNPFEGVFTGFQKTRKRALGIEDLRKLNNLDFSALLENPELQILPAQKCLYDCWRYFFFCFHARGMSYVDMAYLRKENIRQGIISYYRKKTGQKIEVTVTPVLRQIIDSFSNEVKYSPFLFPVISNNEKPHRLQYENGLRLQNKRLKKLARLAGIDGQKGLSTHVTRHSWATTGKLQNLPLSVISEGLGHSSEKMTYTYLASFDRSTIDKASESIAQAIAVSQDTIIYNFPNRQGVF